MRSPYPLPKVTATRSLTLDNYLKPELSSTEKQEDKELDALAPLSTILEETGEDQESKVYQAAKAAVQLVGNASAKLSHLRRKKVVSGLNSALMPLVEEDKNFSKAPPTLFGTEFAQRSKDHVDQVKAIRGLPKQQQRSMPREPFFRGGPPSSRGGEEEETLATGRGEAVPTDPTTATPVDSSGGTQPASQEGRITRTTNSSCMFHPNTPSYKCSEQYPCQSISGHGYLPTGRGPTASWKAGPLPKELEDSNKGPVGAEYSPGLPVRAPGGACSEGTPKPSSVLCGTEKTDRGGGIFPSGKRGSVKHKSTKRRVLFQPVLGPQEGWRTEAGDKPMKYLLITL